MISAVEHFEYCPRQCALIHCDGVWTDNAHTVRGRYVHRRVDSGEARTERGRRVLRAIPLWSEELGLTGRADAVEVYAEQVVPVEYKSGSRHGRTADLQLCAQALCLEEMLNINVPFGFLWYSGPKRRFRVDFTLELRSSVVEIVSRIRSQLISGVLPGAPNDERCEECQLRPHCMPELRDSHNKINRYIDQIVYECGT